MDKKTLLRKSFRVKINSVDDTNHIIRGVFSTNAVDRHGEVIDQSGWNLKEYMQNPVILYGHDQSIPAIGKAIELSVDGNGELSGAIQFAVEEDTSGLAATIYNLYKGGFMRAFSVGFCNDIFEYNQEADQPILKNNTLYEISCVNVPANAMALAYSKGLDLSALPQSKKAKEIVNVLKEEKEIDNIEAKQGKVLSAANRTAIENAMTALQEVLNADSGKSADTHESKQKKVETPIVKDSGYSARGLNKAIRLLLKEKSKHK